jgi:hypothetical protein
MVRRAALVALSALAFLGGCDSEESGRTDGSSATSAETRSTPTSRLAALGQHLAADYEIRGLDKSELPNRRRLITVGNAPNRVRALEGVRVELAGTRPGFIYRYRSKELAVVGAESFLGANDTFDGVSGCGRNVFFSQARGRAAHEWRADVEEYLRRTDPGCRSEAFTIIE